MSEEWSCAICGGPDCWTLECLYEDAEEGSEIKTIESARRDAFENYQVSNGFTDPIWLGDAWFENGKYKLNVIQSEWVIWNAAIDSVEIDFPSRIDSIGCTHVIEQCRDAIHAAGVKTK